MSDEFEKLKKEIYDLRTAVMMIADRTHHAREQQREIAAIRHVANALSAPFTFERVDELLAKWRADDVTLLSIAKEIREGRYSIKTQLDRGDRALFDRLNALVDDIATKEPK